MVQAQRFELPTPQKNKANQGILVGAERFELPTPQKNKANQGILVGAERFELPTPWSQTKCASQTALRPETINKEIS
jgi:hypothetical protein